MKKLLALILLCLLLTGCGSAQTAQNLETTAQPAASEFQTREELAIGTDTGIAPMAPVDGSPEMMPHPMPPETAGAPAEGEIFPMPPVMEGEAGVAEGYPAPPTGTMGETVIEPVPPEQAVPPAPPLEEPGFSGAPGMSTPPSPPAGDGTPSNPGTVEPMPPDPGSTAAPDLPVGCGHPDATVIRQEPTCTENGFLTTSCDQCGTASQTVLPAYGHSFDNGLCTRCGEAEPDTP